ncbi:DNA polymerase III subunit epsilon [Acinetobacter qingfengensis]|uniref:Ribonuclease H n=1 Tax=Acinetobacter qingfengensis TaxID=1262585 RepID=A0A1E7R861_9GAMM|nr:DNA polymerase III subunit epsilon [Acinetobacter qingfengensis]KAA8731421.1 DNA polymerase III subunit epsilon [Acinetobacter qingfengensis]OEY95518.1 DNA polymerase III subunit epsilon [Acinetobacter qingfengensis]
MSNSTQSFTLYVDGACRGNPGIGGWGAFIIDQQKKTQEYHGGELNTTNNRMELTAAIEGILACPVAAQLTIYTDSIYVKRGITEWITGWKAKNWKDVKNPDLWKKLDQACTGRNIEWHWVKGHAGNEGNERADQLANLGADSVTKKKLTDLPESTKNEKDWLLDDPFGLDEDLVAEADDLNTEEPMMIATHIDETTIISSSQDKTLNEQTHTIPAELAEFIKITDTTQHQHGERLLILDTETTGFYYQDGDRIIEVGAIEMINRRLTGSSIHIYINPEKEVGESENIHGLSDDFLSDKPKFQQIAAILFDYLKGAEIVAHNATFDMNFLNAEFERAGFGSLSTVCGVTDTLLLAKRKHPGQKNSLDALVRRYEIPARDRTFHGALLDAEILADVYLAMTGGQVSLDIDNSAHNQQQIQLNSQQNSQPISTPVIKPREEELAAHQAWMAQYREKNDQPSLFEENSPA